MPPKKHEFTVRLSPAQYRILDQLAEKLALDKVSVMRFALARLAESERILPAPPK
jgi:predicted transcriptional regulator